MLEIVVTDIESKTNETIELKNDIENNINYRTIDSKEELIKVTKEFLEETEQNLKNNINSYDSLEELYYSLDKLELQLKKKKINDFKYKIIDIKNIINYATKPKKV